MTDARAYSSEPIAPIPPLPHISRRALKRIPDALPPPDHCRYCGGVVELCNNSEVYGGRSFGDWPYCYLCRACGAYVGLHPDTDLPLGTLADRDLRTKRKEGKTAFYALIKKKNWKRDDAYAWLSETLGVQPSQCHWGMFEAEHCDKAKEICDHELMGTVPTTVSVPLRPSREHLESVARILLPDFNQLAPEQQLRALETVWKLYKECIGRGNFKLDC